MPIRNFKKDNKNSKDKKKIVFMRKKICRFCSDKALVIEYKDPVNVKSFITETGKIIPRRISGNCANHQRKVTKTIKRARNIAVIPYTTAKLG